MDILTNQKRFQESVMKRFEETFVKRFWNEYVLPRLLPFAVYSPSILPLNIPEFLSLLYSHTTYYIPNPIFPLSVIIIFSQINSLLLTVLILLSSLFLPASNLFPLRNSFLISSHFFNAFPLLAFSLFYSLASSCFLSSLNLLFQTSILSSRPLS